MNFSLARFGDIFELADSKRAGKAEYPVLSITMHHGLIDQAEKFKKRVASRDLGAYKVAERNDLVVGFPIDEGVIAFQQKYPKGVVSPAYTIWRVKPSVEADLNYLERYLRSERARAIYRTKMRGTAGRRKILTSQDLADVPVPLPPLAEQRRIADVLDRAEALRAKRRAALAQLDTLAQAAFLEMFGDPIANNKQWTLKQLGDVVSLITYGLTVRPEYHSEGVPLISAKEIRSGSIDYTIASRISDADFCRVSDKAKPNVNDVL